MRQTGICHTSVFLEFRGPGQIFSGQPEINLYNLCPPTAVPDCKPVPRGNRERKPNRRHLGCAFGLCWYSKDFLDSCARLEVRRGWRGRVDVRGVLWYDTAVGFLYSGFGSCPVTVEKPCLSDRFVVTGKYAGAAV